MGSSSRRFFAVQSPVTWICDSDTNTIWRYSNYSDNGWEENHSDIDTVAELDAKSGHRKQAITTLLDGANCQFDIYEKTNSHNGVTAITTILTSPKNQDAGRVRVYVQSHTLNTP